MEGERDETLLTAAELTVETGVQPGERVIVGFSGGADSLTLLLTLAGLGVEVIAAHFDHQIRSESAADAEWARTFCAARGIPIHIESADVPAAARETGASIEDTARRLRYRFLFSLAERERAVAVAVGHHADDQAETILAHFLRGSGLDGLSGMSGCALISDWPAHIPLIRPLLKLRRHKIETWLAERGLTPLSDRTNDDTQYMRNRIRHELIPYLEKTYNPNLTETLVRSADVLRRDRTYLNEAAARAFADGLIVETEREIRLDRKLFRSLPDAIRSRLIRMAAARLGGMKDGITNELIERAQAFFMEAPEECPALIETVWSEGMTLAVLSNEIMISSGAIDWIERYGRVYPLLRLRVEDAASFGVPIPVPGCVDFGNGSLTVERVTVSGDVQAIDAIAEMKRDANCVYLDEDRLTGALTLRPRRKGERFSPFGMNGKSLTVDDFFLNSKIPAKIRALYPLVCDETGPLWVAGLRTADRAALTKATSRALRLRLKRAE